MSLLYTEGMAERYAEHVPAVGRAVEVLQQLVEARGPLSLSALSRYVGASPSSLLAVLTTLRGYGLVERRTADGLYQPGPRLAALGAGAARHLGAHAAFEALLGPPDYVDVVEAALRRVALPAEPLRSAPPVTEHAGPIQASDLDTFLGQGLVATLSYLSGDGYPATVPLWYDWEPDERAFWLVPRAGADWAAHVHRNPRVSLAVSESTPPLRRVLARGPVEGVADPLGQRWAVISRRLLRRYASLDAARYLAAPPAELLRLVPEQLIAWRGLIHHPGLAPAAGQHPEERTA